MSTSPAWTLGDHLGDHLNRVINGLHLGKRAAKAGEAITSGEDLVALALKSANI